MKKKKISYKRRIIGGLVILLIMSIFVNICQHKDSAEEINGVKALQKENAQLEHDLFMSDLNNKFDVINYKLDKISYNVDSIKEKIGG